MFNLTRSASIKYFYLAFTIAFSMFFVGCSEDSPVNTPTVDESKVLLEYLEANGDFINTATPPTITAEALKTLITATPDKAYLVDMRSAEDFAKGHIDKAVNVPNMADLLAHVKALDLTKYDKVVFICYSGQTAAYAASIFRMIGGYDKIVSLRWGMASWHSDFAAKWKSSIGNGKATQFVKTETPKPAAGELPTLSTGKTTGKEIAEARAAQLLSEGFAGVSIKSDEVYSDLTKYFIVNYFTAAHYADAGHIDGAVCYVPKTDLKSTGAVKTIPAAKTVVVYCYTGHTSACATAYLKMLGYNAKTLLYGASGMIYDIMVEKKLSTWANTECKDYDYVK